MIKRRWVISWHYLDKEINLPRQSIIMQYTNREVFEKLNKWNKDAAKGHGKEFYYAELAKEN